MFEITEQEVVCPRVSSPEPLRFDLRDFAWVESRGIEVATVTPLKAPELLTIFTKAWAEAHRMVSAIEYEINMAEAEVARIRGEILLDRVPEILKAKGLASPRSPAGSEDLRQAILDSDPELRQAQDLLYKLKCVRQLFIGKCKNFEMNYSSVKKILDHGGVYQNMDPRRLTGSTGDAEPGQTVSTGFGRPKF